MPVADLMSKDLTPAWVYKLRARLGFGTRWFRQAWKHDLRAILTQIESIVRVNAPLPEGLLHCALDAPNASDIYVLRTLSEKMEAGLSLADAMQTLGTWFPKHYVAVVRAAESTGRLAEALCSLITEINQDLETGRDFRNHVVYFVGILFAQFGITWFLVLKVFPVFVEVLQEFGNTDRTISLRAVMWFSDVLQQYPLHIFAGAGLCVFGALLYSVAYRLFGVVQRATLGALFCIPVARRYFRETLVQQLARALELRLAGGIALPDALRETAADRPPQPYRRLLERCAEEIERGGRLSTAFGARPSWVGTEFVEIIRLGEARENLVPALREAGELFRRRTRRIRHVWNQAIIPIGVGICALGVLALTTSAFSMFAQMSDAILHDL